MSSGRVALQREPRTPFWDPSSSIYLQAGMSKSTMQHLITFGGNDRLLSKLLECGVRFLVVGGLAVRFYIPDREVDDLDLLIEQSGENADRFFNALAFGVFGLANDTTYAAPAIEGFILEFGEYPNTLLGLGKLRGGFLQLWGQNRFQPGITRQSEDKVDVMALAPVHELIPAKAGIGPQDDPDFGPAPADLSDDSLHFLQRAGRSIAVGLPQPGSQ